jgi:hypothetical protein
MTSDQVVERILALREVTLVTGCQTRRAQSELLASLPSELLTEVAVKLNPIFKKDPTRNDRINANNSR